MDHIVVELAIVQEFGGHQLLLAITTEQLPDGQSITFEPIVVLDVGWVNAHISNTH